MKISPTSPVAAAALELARSTLNSRDAQFQFLFKMDPADLTYDLHSKGAVAISSPSQPKGKLTLSAKAHFARVPVVNVRAKDGKVAVGPKSHPMSEAVKKSESYLLLLDADPKNFR